MTFPALTLHDAEAQLADALTAHHASQDRHDASYGSARTQAAMAECEAEDAVHAARRRLETARSAQPHDQRAWALG